MCRVSEGKVELRLAVKDNILSTSMGIFLEAAETIVLPISPRTSFQKEKSRGRVRLSSGKDEDLGNFNMETKLIMPHREES